MLNIVKNLNMASSCGMMLLLASGARAAGSAATTAPRSALLMPVDGAPGDATAEGGSDAELTAARRELGYLEDAANMVGDAMVVAKDISNANDLMIICGLVKDFPEDMCTCSSNNVAHLDMKCQYEQSVDTTMMNQVLHQIGDNENLMEIPSISVGASGKALLDLCTSPATVGFGVTGSMSISYVQNPAMSVNLDITKAIEYSAGTSQSYAIPGAAFTMGHVTAAVHLLVKVQGSLEEFQFTIGIDLCLTYNGESTCMSDMPIPTPFPLYLLEDEKLTMPTTISQICDGASLSDVTNGANNVNDYYSNSYIVSDSNNEWEEQGQEEHNENDDWHGDEEGYGNDDEDGDEMPVAVGSGVLILLVVGGVVVYRRRRRLQRGKEVSSIILDEKNSKNEPRNDEQTKKKNKDAEDGDADVDIVAV